MIFLGIDLGTTSVKVVAMNESGTILAESSAEYPLYYPKPGWAEQNPEDWWQGTITAIKALLTSPSVNASDVVSIGFSGQMHGLVALNQQNQVLRPAILWCDQRTQTECDAITNHFGPKGLLETVSNQALTGFTAPKLLWMKQHEPDLFDQIAHILLPKDYISFRLSGQYVTEVSDASGMLLLDVENRCWSKELCDFIGISDHQLPKLYESYEVTGRVSDEICALFGFGKDTLIVGGAGDQAAGAIGTGAVKDGIISVTLGTSGVVFAAHDVFAADEDLRLHAFCHANGKYHSMGVMLSAASCLKWWTDTVNPDIPFDQLLSEASESPASDDNLLFLPYLMGERTPYPDPYAKGTFIGLTPTTTRGQMTRAILEGVSMGLKDSLKILTSMNIPIQEVRVIGGGAKSNLWLSILASIFGTPVHKINTDQGGALGAAILAAVGYGAYESVESACSQIVKTVECIHPTEAEISLYTKKYTAYQSLYAALKNWFEETAQL